MNYIHKFVDSPVGKLKIIANELGVAAILWPNDRPDRVRLPESVEDNSNAILNETEMQLKEYFEGKRKSFDLKLFAVGTEFQKKVWQALSEIPFGETRSYGELANQLGNPGAVRAVGAANGRNPISIVVPCHRVIGASGKLTGFAGGLDAKAHLLQLEKSL